MVKEFFSLFTSSEESSLTLDKIYDLCLSEAVIIKNVCGQSEIYNLKEFVEPREELLNSGILTNFYEHETWEQTSVFGHIAQRFCVYEKSGSQNGEPFKARGMKSFQFVLIENNWKISALAWDDESNTQKIKSAMHH